MTGPPNIDHPLRRWLTARNQCRKLKEQQDSLQIDMNAIRGNPGVEPGDYNIDGTIVQVSRGPKGTEINVVVEEAKVI